MPFSQFYPADCITAYTYSVCPEYRFTLQQTLCHLADDEVASLLLESAVTYSFVHYKHKYYLSFLYSKNFIYFPLKIPKIFFKFILLFANCVV